MASGDSAKKAHRQAERRRVRNKAVRTGVKTQVKKAETSLVGPASPTEATVVQAIRALDRAVQTGVIHRNNAARRKSRLMAKVNRAAASS